MASSRIGEQVLAALVALYFFYYFNFGANVSPCAKFDTGSPSIADELNSDQLERFESADWGAVRLIPPSVECTAYGTEASGSRQALATETYPAPIVSILVCLIVLAPLGFKGISQLLQRVRHV